MTRSQALFQEIVDSAKEAARTGNWKEWMDSCPAEGDILDWKAGDIYTREKKEHESDKEFKEETDGKLQKVWSEYCGAYANTGGGVLVFGVGEEKGNRDRPGKLKSCYRIEEVRKRLLNLTQSNCDPPVPHVEIEAIPVEEGRGILICHVPESIAKPHKSRRAEKPDFYLRLDDGCFSCPISVLRSLFLLHPEPRLEMELWFSTIELDARQDDGVDVKWKLDLINCGENSVSDMRIQIEIDHVFLDRRRVDLDSWGNGTGGDWVWRSGEQGDVLFRRYLFHPDDRSRLFGGTFAVAEFADQFSATMPKLGFGFIIEISALDMRRKRFLIQLSHQDLLKLQEGTLRISIDPLGESKTEIQKELS